MLGLAGVLRPRAADRAATIFAPQHGVVAGACAAEFTSWLHQDLDGDARKCEAEKANGQDDFRPSHGAKIRGDSWLPFLQLVCIKLYFYIYVYNLEAMLSLRAFWAWALLGSASVFAQGLPAGEACGCPAVSSRDTVFVSDNNGAGVGTQH